MDWTTYLALAPVLWLLLQPELDSRRKRRQEAASRARRREVDLAIVYAYRGRQGLEAVLLEDLHRALLSRRLREEPDVVLAELGIPR